MPIGLVPAPPAGAQGAFLRHDGWDVGTQSSYYLAHDEQWRLGDSEHLFLRGDEQWASYRAGQSYNGLYLGDLVKFGRFFDADIVWMVAAFNHAGFPDNSVTLVSKYLLCLLSFDASEPTNPDSVRATYGNNDYTVANLPQWLNSNAPSGWYAPRHAYDAPPDAANVFGGYNPYTSKPGFLNSFTSAEISKLLATERKIGGRAGNGTTCTEKVWLPTTNEYGFETIANNGTLLPLFEDRSYRLAYPTAQCVANNAYPGFATSQTSPAYYWAATSYPSNTDYVRMIQPDNTISGDSARIARNGVRPAINISLDTVFSSTRDADGCYTVIL